MATRKENIKKINEDLEQLSDEQLEIVVGGIATAYLFMYMKDPRDSNKVIWLDEPFALPIKLNLMSAVTSFFAENAGKFTGNSNLKSTSYSEFRSFVQSYADEHASHWSAPKTWGNLVFSVTYNNAERFEA